jgi:hypothetical protein
MPGPAELWVLFDRRPQLDAPSLACALGPGALVEGTDTVLQVRVRGEALRVIASGEPIPSEPVERLLPAAHLREEQKRTLASHTAHALIVHEESEPGPDGLVALYETAWGLRAEEMLGVMNPVTWMSLTRDILGKTMDPEFVAAVRASPAESLALWLGFVTFFKPDGGAWLATRGASLVGLPDLAWLARDGESHEAHDDAFGIFGSVLDYMHTSGDSLVVGDVVDLGTRELKVRAPYEFVDVIGDETLVIEPR